MVTFTSSCKFLPKPPLERSKEEGHCVFFVLLVVVVVVLLLLHDGISGLEIAMSNGHAKAPNVWKWFPKELQTCVGNRLSSVSLAQRLFEFKHIGLRAHPFYPNLIFCLFDRSCLPARSCPTTCFQSPKVQTESIAVQTPCWPCDAAMAPGSCLKCGGIQPPRQRKVDTGHTECSSAQNVKGDAHRFDKAPGRLQKLRNGPVAGCSCFT